MSVSYYYYYLSVNLEIYINYSEPSNSIIISELKYLYA